MVAKKSTRAAVLNVSAEEVADAFGKFLKVFASYQEQEGGDAVTPAKSASAAKSKPAAEEPEETYTSEEIAEMGIKDLRALAVELELDEVKVKQAIIDELTEKGFIVDEDDDDEDEDEDEDDDEADEDDEDDEDEDDEEEDEGYSREELEEMSLADIRKLAREEGIKVPRGSDQDAIIELILGEDEDEDEDEEDDEDEEESDDKKDDDEDEEITEEEIRAMSLKELQGLAKELGVKVKVPTTAKTSTAKQKAYADAILATVDDE